MNCICDDIMCCGCGACMQKCPVNAISMLPNKEGFLYPVIASSCNRCNACTSVCPILQHRLPSTSICDIYAMQLKNQQLLLQSTSGGAFILFAAEIILRGGVVFGAVYDKNMTVCHTCAGTIEEVFQMQGSKYVQSDLKNTYSEVQDYLNRGQYVLYSGTPCQIEGLLSFLGKSLNRDTLFTIDLVCGGIPSPLLFSKHIESIEQKHNSKVIDYRFRDKNKYGCSHTSVIYEKKAGKVRQTVIADRQKNDYYVAFGKQQFNRPSCYECPFNTVYRNSDFTCSGYWGTNKQILHLGGREGISQLIVHTDKARDLFESLKPQVNWIPISVEDAEEGNRMLYTSIPAYSRQPEMFDYLVKYGYQHTSKKYFPVNKYVRIKKCVLKPIKRWFARINNRIHM